MGEGNTLPERTTHVGPLVVGNQSHKSVKGSLPNCSKVLEEGQPYKLPVGKLEYGHNDKLPEG